MLEIKQNFDLQKYNTFQVKANAKYFVSISSDQELLDLLRDKKYKSTAKLILGEGSNMLFINNFDGLIIHTQQKGIVIESETESDIVVRASAGENWDNLIAYCVQKNWGGLENLSLIPGLVGSSPVQNIGAYGVEAKDCITSVHAIELKTGKKRIFSNEECNFSYRSSIFKYSEKGKFVITAVSFRLSKVNHSLKINYGAIEKTLSQYENKNISTVRQAVIQIRQSKLADTEEHPNAGSFFKNPVITNKKAEKLSGKYPDLPSYPTHDRTKIKIAAGWLIEKAGWKDNPSEKVCVHHGQALVLINTKQANGEEILEFAKKIQADISTKFDIFLDIEVNIIHTK